MAYPRLRSMNDELDRGAIDGKYKQIRPNTSDIPSDTNATYTAREQLSLLYYGIGEARVVDVPGRGTRSAPGFVPNKFEQAEDGLTFGKAW